VGLSEAAGADNPEYRAELGKQLLASSQFDRAVSQADAALALHPRSPAVLNTLGTLLSQLGEHDKALHCFRKAVDAVQSDGSSQPDSWLAGLYFNIGASLQFSGRFDEAARAYEQAIALQPANFRAHWALSSLRKHTPLDNHLERLQALLDKVRHPRDQLHLGHAIAKELEDLGDYESSLKYLTWAKEAARQARRQGSDDKISHDTEQDLALMDNIRRVFDHPAVGGAAENPALARPVFIVGMPRTGTTLVEQIIGAHSRVVAGGEMPYFPAAVRELSGTDAPLGLTTDSLELALGIDPRELGHRYMENARTRVGNVDEAQLFTDKLPLNFLFLGLIRRALPGARFICLRRDPMDTCLSNYRQMFATNFQHYHYNLDLLDCGRYYLGFDALIAHWRSVMPDCLLEVQYETLVSDPERQVRNVLDFCELPWEAQCLDFHERPGSVATPSAVQVRQGIYTSSVERWRRYGDGVQPLFELLRSAGLYAD
jgi:tetratricopeptide (TPR) repeat protein